MEQSEDQKIIDILGESLDIDMKNMNGRQLITDLIKKIREHADFMEAQLEINHVHCVMAATSPAVGLLAAIESVCESNLAMAMDLYSHDMSIHELPG